MLILKNLSADITIVCGKYWNLLSEFFPLVTFQNLKACLLSKKINIFHIFCTKLSPQLSLRYSFLGRRVVHINIWTICIEFDRRLDGFKWCSNNQRQNMISGWSIAKVSVHKNDDIPTVEKAKYCECTIQTPWEIRFFWISLIENSRHPLPPPLLIKWVV